MMLVLNFAESPTPNMKAYFTPNNLKNIVDADTLELNETKTITRMSNGKAIREGDFSIKFLSYFNRYF